MHPILKFTRKKRGMDKSNKRAMCAGCVQHMRFFYFFSFRKNEKKKKSVTSCATNICAHLTILSSSHWHLTFDLSFRFLFFCSIFHNFFPFLQLIYLKRYALLANVELHRSWLVICTLFGVWGTSIYSRIFTLYSHFID